MSNKSQGERCDDGGFGCGLFILALIAIIAGSCATTTVFKTKRMMQKDALEHERLMQRCQDG